MVKIFSITNLEILHYVSGCIQLFDRIYENYGENDQITFNQLFDFYFNHLKSMDKKVSF